MDRAEFQQWGEDLKNKIPDLGDYLWGLPREARSQWFDDIFSRFDLEDAIDVNSKMMETGEGTKRYERGELPKIWIRMLSDVTWARQRREGTVDVNFTAGAQRIVRESGPMGPMSAGLAARIKSFDQSGGEVLSEKISEWAAELSDEFDSDEDDSPWPVKCRQCDDSGWINKRFNRKSFVLCCSACDNGRKRHSMKWKSGRIIGFSAGDAESNPFNSALKET